MNIREILNMLKWKEGFDFDKVEIWYIDRGAPGDVGVIRGEDVERIGRSFIHTKRKSIPFHRVLRILHDGKEIFSRFGVQSKEGGSH